MRMTWWLAWKVSATLPQTFSNPDRWKFLSACTIWILQSPATGLKDRHSLARPCHRVVEISADEGQHPRGTTQEITEKPPEPPAVTFLWFARTIIVTSVRPSDRFLSVREIQFELVIFEGRCVWFSPTVRDVLAELGLHRQSTATMYRCLLDFRFDSDSGHLHWSLCNGVDQ